MGSRLNLLAGRVLRSLWFTPALYATGALAVLLIAPAMASLLPEGLKRVIGLQGLYDLLNALVGTLLTVAIFSLGIMVASLRAAGLSASPRVRPLLAEDGPARRAISTFIGGFVFAVVGVVGLSTGYYNDAAKVLLFFVTCLVILALIVALIRWIGRLGRLGGVTEAIDLVEAATRPALEDAARSPYLGGVPSDGLPRNGVPIEPETVGYVQAIEVEKLGALAGELAVDLYLMARPGAFVGPGRPLLLTTRSLAEKDRRRLKDQFVLGKERTYSADPRFGLTVLSEIASRALSPAVNDPGTAIDVISRSIRLLVGWSDVSAQAHPEVRYPHLHVEPLAAADLLADAFSRIARDGATLLEVQLCVQNGLEMLVVKDEARFGASARALSFEALARAEAGLTLAKDKERLRTAAMALRDGLGTG